MSSTYYPARKVDSYFLDFMLHKIPVSGYAVKYNPFLKDQKILKTNWLCNWDTNKPIFYCLNKSHNDAHNPVKI